MMLERLARRGQSDAAGMPFEQFGANRGLEVCDTLASRTYRKMSELSAFADAPAANHKCKERE
jgi:hypothetical protein